MAADNERIPVHVLSLSPGELGTYDADGSVREYARRSSAARILDFAFQAGHTDEEADRALDEFASALKKGRRISRQNKTRKSN